MHRPNNTHNIKSNNQQSLFNQRMLFYSPEFVEIIFRVHNYIFTEYTLEVKIEVFESDYYGPPTTFIGPQF